MQNDDVKVEDNTRLSSPVFYVRRVKSFSEKVPLSMEALGKATYQASIPAFPLSKMPEQMKVKDRNRSDSLLYDEHFVSPVNTPREDDSDKKKPKMRKVKSKYLVNGKVVKSEDFVVKGKKEINRDEYEAMRRSSVVNPSGQKLVNVLSQNEVSSSDKETERKLYRQNFLFLWFTNKETENKFLTYFYSLEAPISRITISFLIGLMGSIAICGLTFFEFEEMPLTAIISLVNLYIPLSLLVFSLFKITRKYIFLNEMLYGTYALSVTLLVYVQYQNNLWSVPALFVAQLASGTLKPRFYVLVVSNVFFVLLYFPLTITFYYFVPWINEDFLTPYPFVFVLVNSFATMMMDYVLENKIRRSFVNIEKLNQRKEDIKAAVFEVKKILFNILPPLFIDDIVGGKQIDKDKYILKIIPNGSIIFADLISFTSYSETVTPIQLISTLNVIFTCFDYLSLKFDLEKISTQGDAFLAVGYDDNDGGDQSHILKLVLFGIGMIRVLNHLCKRNGWDAIKIRSGIACGELYLVCMGSIKTGVTFDVQGPIVKHVKDLQDKALESSLLIEERYLKEQYFTLNVDYDNKTYFLSGKCDKFFEFSKVFVVSNDFAKENMYMVDGMGPFKNEILKKYMTKILDGAKRVTSSHEELEMMKQEYLDRYKAYGEIKFSIRQQKSFVALKQRKTGIFYGKVKSLIQSGIETIKTTFKGIDYSLDKEEKKLQRMKSLSRSKSGYLNTSNIDLNEGRKKEKLIYIPLLLSFKRLEIQMRFSKYKNSRSLINIIMFFVYLPIYVFTMLCYFITRYYFEFYYTSYLAFALYATLASQIVSILLIPLAYKSHIFNHALTFASLIIYQAGFLIFFLSFLDPPFLEEFMRNNNGVNFNVNVDGLAEMINYANFFFLVVSPCSPLMRIFFLCVNYITPVIYKVAVEEIFEQDIYNHLLGPYALSIFVISSIVITEYFDVSNFVKQLMISKCEEELNKERSTIKTLIFSILPRYIVSLLQKTNEEIKQRKKLQTFESEHSLGNLEENFEATRNLKLGGEQLNNKTFNSSNRFVFFVGLRNFNKVFKRDVRDAIKLMSVIFDIYDRLVKAYRGIKIKSVEDTYIFITRRADAGVNICKGIISRTNEELNKQKKLSKNERLVQVSDGITGVHIGVQYGNICSGVLGSLKYRYDIIGDVVNTSARLCTGSLKVNNVVNSVHMMESIFPMFQSFDHKVKKKIVLYLKGKGNCKTTFLKFL